MDKNMQINFEWLKERTLDCNRVSNLNYIKEKLSEIKDNCLCVGVGGSSVVSEFACKVLNKKNDCFAINKEPRDLLYENLFKFKNILICSYSGNNYGVEVSLDNDLNKYLLTNGDIKEDNVNTLRYLSSIDKERSFISLGATLMPMSILLNYYLSNGFEDIINDMFNNIESFNFKGIDTFEIMSGIDTSVASTYLESTMTEAGLCNPVVHYKYEYCHGRTTLPYHTNHDLIYLHNNISDIDKVIMEEAKTLYNEVIILGSNYNDIVIDNFNLTLKAMYLTKHLGELKQIDLSDVDYAPSVKKLYRFNGSM